MFEICLLAGPWVLCLGALTYMCIGLWLDEKALRRLSRLASTIELSAEAWEMAARGELSPTEYCRGAERLYEALLRERDDPSEEFHREIFDFPAYLAASFGAFCRRLASGHLCGVRQRISAQETNEAIDGGSIGTPGAVANRAEVIEDHG